MNVFLRSKCLLIANTFKCHIGLKFLQKNIAYYMFLSLRLRFFTNALCKTQFQAQDQFHEQVQVHG